MIHAGKLKGLTAAQKKQNRELRATKEMGRPWRRAQSDLTSQQSMIRTLDTFSQEAARKKAIKEARVEAAIDAFLDSIKGDDDDSDEGADSCDKLPVGQE